jgi:hypothetical protein
MKLISTAELPFCFVGPATLPFQRGFWILDVEDGVPAKTQN